MDQRVSFTEAHLQLFAAASGDRNPLHLSPEYASRTSYGEQVVFGALGALAALGQHCHSRAVQKLTVDFLRPMFLGVQYRSRVVPQNDGVLIRLLDGAVPVLAVAVNFGEGEEPSEARPPAPSFPRNEPKDWPEGAILPGLTVTGRYGAEQQARDELCRVFDVRAPSAVLDALLWGSYAVGMELPGSSALFFRFVAQFQQQSFGSGLIDYRLRVKRLDPRLGLAIIDMQLSSDGTAVAEGTCSAFVRPPAPDCDEDLIAQALPASRSLEGKVALVIGASRGLGAAITWALGSQGAAVWAASRTAKQSGSISYVAADASDPSALAQLRDRILERHPGIDLVVANAFPAILPLTVEPEACDRIRQYIARATDLVLGPLCVFAKPLAESRGTFVLISSEAVEQPVKQWPHYVAAKRAAEALAEVTALQQPALNFLIVRPQKLLTEMTNTPMGRIGAVRPEIMAANIVRRLCEEPKPGRCELLRGSDT